MRRTLQCVSPIDGSVCAERPVISMSEAHKAVTAARDAQSAWAARPLQERIDLVRAGVAEIGRTSDEIVPELAWQMGRPVRYGGEFSGFEERAIYMAGIAEDALQSIVVENSETYERRILREPHGLVFVIAPWNYPYIPRLPN